MIITVELLTIVLYMSYTLSSHVTNSYDVIITSSFSVLTVAGVLYVNVHSANGLQSADSDGLSDPYCLVLANKKKV